MTAAERFMLLVIASGALLLLRPTSHCRADVITTGNVMPDPNTTTGDDDLVIAGTFGGSMTINGGTGLVPPDKQTDARNGLGLSAFGRASNARKV